MKKLSTIFAALAILLTNIMCVVVTNICTSGYYAEKHFLTGAPWEVGLLFAIPFVIGIIICSIVSHIAKKKGK
ncbi:MAG: hypothetical protein IKC00_06390 [Clostridia bacterium]|nr:hypothetical protein [Clostridia bacterium]